jgi:LSD1 subclass zinc finger protein
VQTFLALPSLDLAGARSTQRRLLTSLPRGAGATEVRCSACTGLLAVGHRPDDLTQDTTLIRCAQCHRYADLSTAVLDTDSTQTADITNKGGYPAAVKACL